MNRNVQQINIAQLKRLDRKLRAIEPGERAQQLTYEGAINVEAQVIRSVFRWALGLEVSSTELTDLKYWDSPIKVLKAFVMYCLQYESAIVEYSLGGEHILGLFILTAHEHIRDGRLERPAELSQQVAQSQSRTREAWKKRLVLLANLSAIDIHNRSAAVAAQACEEDKRFESIRQELKDNYRACHRKLEEKLWRRAS